MLNSFREIIYAVSTAVDGNMSYKWGPRDEVLKNRERFFTRHSIDISQCVMMHTPHEDDIAVIDGSMIGKGMNESESAVEVDAFITRERDIFLCLLTADCLPITVYDPEKNVIALAHLGWRSTAQYLSKKLIERLVKAFGTDPAKLQVEIGPGIHVESYVKEVTENMERPEWPEPYLQWIDTTKFRMDIVAANQDQIVSAGVDVNRITISSIDTAADVEYFSHYREKRTGEPEARFMTVIGMKK